MGYEDAPATKLIATHCCVCGRALLDADSVQCGMGKVCRQRYGVTPDVDPHWEHFDFLVQELAGEPWVQELRPMVDGVPEDQRDARRLANKITHFVAASRDRLRDEKVDDAIRMIKDLGYVKTAGALCRALYKIRLFHNAVKGWYRVVTPFSEQFGHLMKRERIGRWNKDRKCYFVHERDKKTLLDALRVSYAGQLAIGPKGQFVL